MAPTLRIFHQTSMNTPGLSGIWLSAIRTDWPGEDIADRTEESAGNSGADEALAPAADKLLGNGFRGRPGGPGDRAFHGHIVQAEKFL